ncbi:phage portal protein, partial [Patescibacteria group bacterium]|nr:phage portal protein [Patescibacteria group bacterium]
MATLEEFDTILKEATTQVEAALSLEDSGWINLSAGTEVIPAASRKATVQEARLYGLKDPLAKRAVALMTDYSFGGGIAWNAEDKKADMVLSDFWYAPYNKAMFSSKGQRKSSDKLLIDGEIFFAVFLGKNTTIRRIDPLEITEFITDPDDLENVRYFKREWADAQSRTHEDYYCSFANIKNKACLDSLGVSHQKTQEALVYHLAINDLHQRGNSYLLPALEWIK